MGINKRVLLSLTLLLGLTSLSVTAKTNRKQKIKEISKRHFDYLEKARAYLQTDNADLDVVHVEDLILNGPEIDLSDEFFASDAKVDPNEKLKEDKEIEELIRLENDQDLFKNHLDDHTLSNDDLEFKEEKIERTKVVRKPTIKVDAQTTLPTIHLNKVKMKSKKKKTRSLTKRDTRRSFQVIGDDSVNGSAPLFQ